MYQYCSVLPPVFADHEMVERYWVILVETVFEMCHAKTGLKTFVGVIPKERLPATSSAKPSFGMTQTIEALQEPYNFIADVKPKEGLAALVPDKPSFGMTKIKLFGPVFTWRSSCDTGFTDGFTDDERIDNFMRTVISDHATSRWGEVCAAKMRFFYLCHCHTKRRIGGRGPANTSFDVFLCHTKRRIGGALPTVPSFGMQGDHILENIIEILEIYGKILGRSLNYPWILSGEFCGHPGMTMAKILKDTFLQRTSRVYSCYELGVTSALIHITQICKPHTPLDIFHQRN